MTCSRCSGSRPMGWSPVSCIFWAVLTLLLSVKFPLLPHIPLYNGKQEGTEEDTIPFGTGKNFPYYFVTRSKIYHISNYFRLKALKRHKGERLGNTLDWLTLITMKIDMNSANMLVNKGQALEITEYRKDSIHWDCRSTRRRQWPSGKAGQEGHLQIPWHGRIQKRSHRRGGGMQRIKGPVQTLHLRWFHLRVPRHFLT